MLKNEILSPENNRSLSVNSNTVTENTVTENTETNPKDKETVLPTVPHYVYDIDDDLLKFQSTGLESVTGSPDIMSYVTSSQTKYGDIKRIFPSQKSTLPVNDSINLLLRDYLYRVYTGKTTHPDFTVEEIFSRTRGGSFFDSPVYSYDDELSLYFNGETNLDVRLVLRGSKYKITISTEVQETTEGVKTIHYLYMSGLSNENSNNHSLERFLMEECVKTSGMKNNSFVYEPKDENFFKCLTRYEPTDLTIDDIFIPEDKKEEIERFIYSVENFKTDSLNLRYLLNGLPGTGKTQLMKVISNRLHGKATILFAQQCREDLKNVFSFMELFEPSVLFLDDLDLIIGSRDNKFSSEVLGDFLGKLDGVLPKSLFLVGTTNDKTLVDKAASRPGRFDLIMDISEVDNSNYLNLVRRETTDTRIVDLFTPEILKRFKEKKVTGSFIVSFVKQLKSTLLRTGELTPEKFDSMFNLIHRGFYSDNSGDKIEKLGF